MKTKKLGKKLTLNKQTISQLDNAQMDSAKGGTFTDVRSCELTLCKVCTYYACTW